MKSVFVFFFVSLSILAGAQSTFVSTESGGAWNSASTWICADVPCASSIPLPGDIVLIAVTGSAFVSLQPNQAVSLQNLIFFSDVPNDALRTAAGINNTPPVITISGSLFSLNRDYADEAPVNRAIHNASQRSPRLVFTGSSVGPSDPLIYSWGINAPLRNVDFNLSSETRVIESFAVANGGSLTVTSGTLNLESGSSILNPFASGIITVAANAVLSIAGAVNGNGTDGSQFNTVNINGALRVQSSGYLNANNITLGTGGTLITLAGLPNTGWYRNSAPGGILNFANGSVNYGGSNQTVVSTTYGALSLTGSGTKSANAGNLILGGTLTIGTGVIFNSTAVNALTSLSNIDNAGIWAPTQVVRFEGSGTQIIQGNPVVFAGGIDIGNAVNTPLTRLQFQDNGDINGPLRIFANATLDINGNNLALAGNLTAASNAVIAINSSSLLSFDGTTLLSGAGTLTLPSVLVIGTVTAPASLNIQGNFSIAAQGVYNASTNLSLSGNFVNNGTFVNNSGTIVFNGTTDQTISGASTTTFRNITIANDGNLVSIESNQNLRGVLTLTDQSRFDADGADDSSNNIFTLLSSADDPTLDAAIAALPAAAAFEGRITVQRYMAIEGSNQGRIYRYISAPVIGGTIADMQNEIPITGSFTGANNNLGTSPSLFYYSEPVITDINGNGVNDLNDGWIAYPTGGTNAQTFQIGRGYSLFVRGNLLTGSARWDLRGTLLKANTTPFNFQPTYTRSGPGNTPVDANDGWNLVGNPFPSTIDWNSIGWNKGNLNGSIYIIDNSAANGAVINRSYNGVVGVNGGTRYIATGQAFYVKASALNPVLTADESVKAAGIQTTFFREAPLQNLLRATLVNGSQRDETVIHFREDATDGFDHHADSWKLKNSTFNFYSIAERNKLSINSRSLIGCGALVQLGIDQMKAGEYTIEFSEYESFEKYTQIRLVDSFTNSVFDINSGNYSFVVNQDPASYHEFRFSLQVSNELQAPSTIVANEVCNHVDVAVEVLASRPGILYSISKEGLSMSDTLEGNGSAIFLKIPADKLSAGVNVIYVEAFSPCGATIKKELSLIVSSPPSIISVENGQVCTSGTVQLSATATDPTASFRWYTSLNSSDPFLTQESAIFNTPSLTKTRNYFVAAISSLGCEGERFQVTATVVLIDSVKIRLAGDQLFSNHQAGNQWYLNGEILPGGTQASVKIESEGLYQLVVTSNGCTAVGEINIDKKQSFLPEQVSLYPNPVRDILSIVIPETSESFTVKLSNNMGKEIDISTLATTADNKTAIDMRGMAAGIYFVKMQNVDKIYTFKVVKQ